MTLFSTFQHYLRFVLYVIDTGRRGRRPLRTSCVKHPAKLQFEYLIPIPLSLFPMWINPNLLNYLKISDSREWIYPFRLAVGDSNWARSASVKNHAFLDCQACRASAQLRFPHQKSIFFRTWIVQRSFCDKFIARQGKSTVNTWCINEHFDEVLRRIYCKNRTRFESPTAKPCKL